MSAFHSNLLSGITTAPTPQSIDDLAGIARSKGYAVKNNQAVSYTPSGIPIYQPLGNFASSNSFLNQATDLLGSEYQAKQAAADRQFDRNNAQIDQFGRVLSTVPGTFDKATSQTNDYIDSIIGNIKGLSDSQASEIRKGVSDLISGAQTQANSAISGIDSYTKAGVAGLNRYADAAVGTASSAISQYNTGIDENVIQATVSGIRRNADSQQKLIDAGLNPDGTRMTSEQRAEASRQLRFDTGQQIAQTAASVRAQQQQTLASLRTNLAGVELQAGQLKGQAATLGTQGEEAKLAAGQTVTQARATGLQAILSSQEGQRQFQSIVAGLAQFRSNLANSNSIQSLQFQLNGQESLAQLVQSNPETVFGVLSSFLALGQIASAPGGRNIPALYS